MFIEVFTCRGLKRAYSIIGLNRLTLQMKALKLYTRSTNVLSTSRFKQNVRRHERRQLTEEGNPPDVEESRISILCDQCARPFKTKRGLQLHVQTKHLKIFRFKCSVCPAQFNMLAAFRGHLPSHHKELKEKCSQCGAAFQYKQTLKDHKKKVHNIPEKKKHTCEESQQNFSCRDTLLQHKRGMHGGKAFDCPKCNKTYRWRSSLAYPTATVRHSPQCSICT